MMQKKKDIFNQQVSVFGKATDTEPITTATILQVLTSKKVTPKVKQYRETGDKAIKLSIPCFIPSGVFSSRKDEALLQHSGVVCIDIDGKDNTGVVNFEELKKLIVQIPYVAYCGLSVGGKGFFLLVPIRYPEKHREQFKAVCEDFERCGLLVDKACINVSRLRFMSYDPDAYYNREAAVYTRVYQEKKIIHSVRTYENNTANDVEKLINEIRGRGIDITGSYQEWLEIGASIASEFGEAGRSYFHEISQYSAKYKPGATDRKYSDCLKMRNFSIGTLFYYAKQYGLCDYYEKPAHTEPKPQPLPPQPAIQEKPKAEAVILRTVGDLLEYAYSIGVEKQIKVNF